MVLQEKGSECFIICTQPRRIAAISIAERVSHENMTSLGFSILINHYNNGYIYRRCSGISD